MKIILLQNVSDTMIQLYTDEERMRQMNKAKKTVLNNIGFIVDDESGEIIKPTEGDYRIVL